MTTSTIAELTIAARNLNMVLGKRPIDEISDILLSDVEDEQGREIIHAIIGDEMAGMGVSRSHMPIHVAGVLQRLETQIRRLSV